MMGRNLDMMSSTLFIIGFLNMMVLIRTLHNPYAARNIYDIIIVFGVDIIWYSAYILAFICDGYVSKPKPASDVI